MRRLFANTTALIIVIGIIALMEYYTIVAIRLASRHQGIYTKWAIWLGYIALSAFVYWTIISFKAIEQNEYPSWIKTIASPLMLGFVISKVFILITMLGGDIYRVIRWFLNLGMKNGDLASATKQGIPRSQFLAQAALATAGIALTGFAYGIRNKYKYNVRHVKIPLLPIQKALAGLKIVQISDIHAGSFDDAAAVAEGVQLIMDQKADLILFTGDIVNNTQDELVPYLDIFSRLKAPLGVYSVLGNHDYGDYVSWPSPADKARNLQLLQQHFATMGWQLLNNTHKILPYNGHSLALIGVENWSSRANFPKYGKLSEALNGLAADSDAFTLLMSHDPSHWDADVITNHKNIQLTLSGHTHGMQFGIRLPHWQWSPVQYVYHRWNGLYREGNQYLYVNPGYGFIGYKGRVGILPEITVLELTA